jgi:hypothetical protein
VSIKRGDDEQGRAYSERKTKKGENSGGGEETEDKFRQNHKESKRKNTSRKHMD